MSEPDAAGSQRRPAGLGDLEVNNTLYWRLITISLLRLNATSRRISSIFRRRQRPHVGHVFPLSHRMVVKTGSDVRLDEAATMRFITDHTNIPVPRVLSAFVRKGTAYIVMEKIQGEELSKVWHHISDQTKADLLDQLRQHVDELRALPQPTEFAVGSCIGGSLQDFRQSRAPPPVRFGPFKTIQYFHSWLRGGLKQVEATNMEPGDLKDVEGMISRQEGPWPPPVFTHGDLNPSNILVRDGKIVGIIDWEMAGWYPHYWEYTSLKMASDLVNPVWHENIERFLSPTPDELNMEKVRFRWWGNVC